MQKKVLVWFTGLLSGRAIKWFPVHDSTRIVREAYDKANERILVEFLDGTKWQYFECSREVWKRFRSNSRGRFIFKVLNHHPHGEYNV